MVFSEVKSCECLNKIHNYLTNARDIWIHCRQGMDAVFRAKLQEGIE